MITAQAQVDLDAPPPLPHALAPNAWDEIDRQASAGEDWDFRQPSDFTPWSDPLLAFVDSLGPAAQRDGDPLTTVRHVMAGIYREF